MAGGPSITGLSVNAFGNAVPRNQPSFTIPDLNGATANPNQITAQAQARNAGATLRIPNDTPPYWVSLGISAYSRSSWRTVGTLSTNSTLVLPLPVAIEFTQSVNYEEKELGAAGALAQTTLGGSLPQAIAQSLGNIGQSAASAVGAAALAVAGANGGRAVNGAAQGTLAAAGVAVNNFATLMLKGPNYRTFTLRFILSPRNEAETETLSTMFQLINNNQAPGLGAGLASMFFTYPSLFQVTYNGPTDMGYRLHRFKPAFLRNAGWDFTSGAPPAFYKGTSGPETVTVTLEFIEAEYWLQGDFN